ncbi:hypothetical protein Ssi03_77500 [Sphaerisporangium siamense]|uniref:Uncharacterized protein n=1 Tax=Sphaerisporangium siamense TaxID=795645 RepID=A0A7W7DDC2_9ACTN|nr:hypothetical protein [Sphaerisporangium siamense]MBB4704745.1 hypothetical protein [Sphaerisporangium siamense]GII89760.1 hypothetical protein Ssi03_77500 [Sphaerisporangium siamense]
MSEVLRKDITRNSMSPQAARPQLPAVVKRAHHNSFALKGLAMLAYAAMDPP